MLDASGFFGTFISPAGNFSTLGRNTDATFTRRLKNGTTIAYDAQGFMTARVDRNGTRICSTLSMVTGFTGRIHRYGRTRDRGFDRS